MIHLLHTWFVSASKFMLTFSIERNEVKGTKLQQKGLQEKNSLENKHFLKLIFFVFIVIEI
jgi:hypothetical protein